MNDTHDTHDMLSLEGHDRASRRLRRLSFLLTMGSAFVVAVSVTIVIQITSSASRTVDSYQDRLDGCWAARKSLMRQAPELDP